MLTFAKKIITVSLIGASLSAGVANAHTVYCPKQLKCFVNSSTNQFYCKAVEPTHFDWYVLNYPQIQSAPSSTYQFNYAGTQTNGHAPLCVYTNQFNQGLLVKIVSNNTYYPTGNNWKTFIKTTNEVFCQGYPLHPKMCSFSTSPSK